MLKVVVVLFLLSLVYFPHMLTATEFDFTNIEATGSILLFNDSSHMGLWTAVAYLDNIAGELVSMFTNNESDIFIVTVRGEDLIFDDDGLTIVGTGFVAKNGVLLDEGNGVVKISENIMEIKVNDDVVVSGHTLSFEMK
ncbi:MAG: hypothetical protein CMO16_00960 [Thaumarchaeota archaeon]|nr:hypothetical protein [Nitrososphaerota archaeon]